jgi:hypothetical protein
VSGPEVGVDAEGEGFAQFVAARQRALQRTVWLLTSTSSSVAPVCRWPLLLLSSLLSTWRRPSGSHPTP